MYLLESHTNCSSESVTVYYKGEMTLFQLVMRSDNYYGIDTFNTIKQVWSSSEQIIFLTPGENEGLLIIIGSGMNHSSQ